MYGNTTIYPATTDKSAQEHEYFAGALGYNLSPINLVLSLLILSQNSVIIKCYYEDRARFSAAMYIAIAIVDMIAAQGSIVLSVAGILVESLKMDIQNLYYCIYFYQATASFAYTSSEFYSTVLIVVMTCNIYDPFRRINFRRIRIGLVVLTVFFSILCFCDAVLALYADMSGNYKFLPLGISEFHVLLLVFTNMPGVSSLVSLVYIGFHSHTQYTSEHQNKQNLNVFVYLTFIVYFVLPPIVLLLSAILLVAFLRNAVRGHDSTNLTSHVTHVSVTVLLVASVSFLCHSALVVMVVITHFKFVMPDHVIPFSWIDRGRIAGSAEVTLPLLNATLFPIILISRSQTLQDKFIGMLLCIGRGPRNCWEKLKSVLNLTRSDPSYEYL